jgi:RNA polymerase sigma factor (sigma-70 family)
MKRDARQILTELLVLRSQGGSERAFRDLHELWIADVQRMAVAKLVDVQAAREVAQEVWVTIARGLSRIQDPACFPRWALQIVHRRSVDWIRRRQRERRPGVELEKFRAGVDGEEGVSSADSELTNLTEAIAELTGSDRDLLRLFYESGRSVAEISEILEVPIGTVKSRLFAVRERLKSQIGKVKL